ncbi:hypothetical protein [Pseudomonas sp. 2835]|uniref:hypothetical protein n=1 Tax=Pseudomonas sp. 2835 TaxID=3156451 RepID=UPI003D1F5A93
MPAGACRTPAFFCCEQHDYDGADFTSGQAYSQTMALCLSGGVSEPVTFNLARRLAPKVKWPEDLDLESRTAP